MSDLLTRGLLLFNDSRFFEAHEVWEDLWRETPQSSLRTGYQGLIQSAVALHHLSRQNYTGAQNQLRKAIANLTVGDSEMRSLDVQDLIRQLQRTLQALPNTPKQMPRIASLK